MIFHKHDWVKIAVTYAEPIDVRTFRMDPDTAAKGHGLLQGLTTIIWECSICKKIRREEMVGKQAGLI